MNPISIVILAVILLAAASVAVFLWRRRGSGCSHCTRADCPARRKGGGCSSKEKKK